MVKKQLKRPGAAVVFLLLVVATAITLYKIMQVYPTLGDAGRNLARRAALTAIVGIVAAVIGVALLPAAAPGFLVGTVAFGAFFATGAWEVGASFGALPHIPGLKGPSSSDGCPPGWQVGSGSIGCVQVER